MDISGLPNQQERGGSLYVRACGKVAVLLRNTVMEAIRGDEEEGNGEICNCVVHAVLIHDFGGEKIRFVCEQGGRGRTRGRLLTT